MKKDMTRRKTGSTLLFTAALLVLSLALSGCAELKINLHRHLYKPEIPEAIASLYKGKQIDMNGFLNQDKKTRIWTYYSPDKSIAYEAQVPLEYFVLDCFRDAFWIAGASVLKDSPTAKIPDLAIIIDRWTDQEFKFTATITKDNALKYRNQYKVTMPAVENKDPEKLQKNAYDMINKAILAVMTDQQVQQAIVK